METATHGQLERLGTVVQHMRYRAERARQDSQDADISQGAKAYLRGVYAAAEEATGRIAAAGKNLFTCYSLPDRLERLADEYDHRAKMLEGFIARECEAPCDLSEDALHGQQGRASVFGDAARTLRYVVGELYRLLDEQVRAEETERTERERKERKGA